MYEDKVINCKRGEAFYFCGRLAYRFRCGPANSEYWNQNSRRDRGARNRVYGTFRHPHTLNSRRMAEAHKAEGIHVRKKSNFHLPDAWDDYYYHTEKSWKYQSKRSRQWK